MLAVIGDIHGCYFTLKKLVEGIKHKYPAIPIYSVGDLIDRGNFSFEVFEFVLKEKIFFTPGNHEYMFYYFIRHPNSAMGDAWLYNGSDATIRSYNGRMNKVSEHLDAVIKAPLYFNLEDCFICHAGISSFYKSRLPNDVLSDLKLLNEVISADLTNEHGILWSRDILLDLGKLQVVGHTRQDEVTFIKENNTVYIDTSAVGDNKLSAIIVEKNEIADVISVPTFSDDIY